MVDLTVYYDGLCKVCSHEIDFYRRRDSASRVRWVDIMDPGFSAAAEGFDPAQAANLHEEMHSRLSDGTVVVGVDSFIEIWKVIPAPGLRTLASLASRRWVKPVLKLGYLAFTRVRPFLPRKAGGVSCEDGSCGTRKP